ncbi:hypothetical protein SteCoe_16306 [Stentor coeruleus]|uniref:Uncharacterized protein n=1 Tax=Stentor coeruleus TaxID=5963 RepID=A0A1R2C1K9_9CILI|nr:hypothetical protein SteCoe_16306 [Stentor coeruleus]
MSNKKLTKMPLSPCQESRFFRSGAFSRMAVSLAKSLSPRFADTRKPKDTKEDLVINMVFSSVSGFSDFT